MERIICLVVGYICGLLQTGYLYGKMNRIDIRNFGSGNSGTTNALRVMGMKAGAIVFFGDFLKSLIPCLLVRYIFKEQPEMGTVLMMYMGLGVILGHNYPFYLNFKGGKGIAATAGLIVALDLRLTVICLAAFLIIVAVTRFVSLGSLIVATIFFLWMAVSGYLGGYGLHDGFAVEFVIVAFVISAQAFWRHRANIDRLLHGKENKIGSGKK